MVVMSNCKTPTFPCQSLVRLVQIMQIVLCYWIKLNLHLVLLLVSFYSGFRRKARVIKCNRFPRQKGGHGPRRSMRRLRKLGTRNTTLLACDRKFWQVSRHKRPSRIPRCRSFSERLGPRIIFFKASQVSSCSKRQFSWDNNWADRMWLLLLF